MSRGQKVLRKNVDIFFSGSQTVTTVRDRKHYRDFLFDIRFKRENLRLNKVCMKYSLATVNNFLSYFML